jgi:asparagine synthase (glutamine-hydrolysing)
MSAIVGLVQFDRRPGHERIVAAMLDRMAIRGPHGRAQKSLSHASFGHLLLHTTEESLHENLPNITSINGDETLLTATTRLDNRDELLTAAKFPNNPTTPDSALITAHLHTPARLLGDFAYAAWNNARQTLFCARDQFGVKPFYYYCAPGRFFIFASQIRALFAHPEVPSRLNKTRLAQYWLGQLPDHVITFYEEIHRLPAAHTLTVDANSLRLTRYWSLDLEREITLKSDAEYDEAFRAHFARAVKTRLNTPFKIGFQLSGGLDSTAIACVARDALRDENRLPAHVYSQVFPTVPNSDESPYIHAALDQPGFAPTIVEGDRSTPLNEIDLFLNYDDEGNYNTNSYLVFMLHRRMAAGGVRVCIDGYDGDTTIGHGCYRLGELARQKDWAAFDRELKAYCRRGNWDRRGTALQFAGPALTQLLRAGQYRQFLRDAREAAPWFRSGWRQVISRTGLQPFVPPSAKHLYNHLAGVPPDALAVLQRLIDPKIAAAVRLPALTRAFEAIPVGEFPSERAYQAHILATGGFTGGLERFDYLAGHFQMENRHPFMDQRLVEFCLALPSSQKLSDGFTRTIMRRALQHTLPEKISKRVGKCDLTDAFRDAFLRRDKPILDQWIVQNPALAGLCDLTELRDLYARCLANEATDGERFILFRVLTSARWMRHATFVIA